MRSSQLHVSSVQVSVVLPAIEAVSHLALRLHHVLDHGQEGHLVLDALGQRQVALESAVQRLALLRALGHNHLGHLHLASAPLIAAGMHHVHRSKYKYKSNDSLSGWYLTAALSGWSPPQTSAQVDPGSGTHLIPEDALWRVVSAVRIEEQLGLVWSPGRQGRSFSVSLDAVHIPVSCPGKFAAFMHIASAALLS